MERNLGRNMRNKKIWREELKGRSDFGTTYAELLKENHKEKEWILKYRIVTEYNNDYVYDVTITSEQAVMRSKYTYKNLTFYNFREKDVSFGVNGKKMQKEWYVVVNNVNNMCINEYGVIYKEKYLTPAQWRKEIKKFALEYEKYTITTFNLK